MPRTPPDHPRGRPTGTGLLGAQTRLTVQIPVPLYDRLEAFAAGRQCHDGRPPLARCVREALEAYLDRQSTRQTPTRDREAAPPRESSDARALQTLDEPWARQAVVALILRWRLEGLTKTAIATRLNAARVPLLAGTGRWNLRKVNRALWDVPKSARARQAFLARYAPTTAPALGREG